MMATSTMTMRTTGNDGDEHNDDEDDGKRNDVGDGKGEQQQPADSILNLLNKNILLRIPL